MTAIRCVSGSIRTSRIVSERGLNPSFLSSKRSSEPSRRNVRGSPASARVTSGMSIAVRPSCVNSSVTSLISSSTADATAVAESEIVRIPAISARISTPRPGFGGPRLRRLPAHARPPSTARSSVAVSEKRSGTLRAKSVSAHR